MYFWRRGLLCNDDLTLYIVSNREWLVSNESERIWRKQSRPNSGGIPTFAVGTEEIKEFQSGQLVFWQRFKLNTSRTKVQNVTATSSCLVIEMFKDWFCYQEVKHMIQILSKQHNCQIPLTSLLPFCHDTNTILQGHSFTHIMRNKLLEGEKLGQGRRENIQLVCSLQRWPISVENCAHLSSTNIAQ